MPSRELFHLQWNSSKPSASTRCCARISTTEMHVAWKTSYFPSTTFFFISFILLLQEAAHNWSLFTISIPFVISLTSPTAPPRFPFSRPRSHSLVCPSPCKSLFITLNTFFFSMHFLLLHSLWEQVVGVPAGRGQEERGVVLSLQDVCVSCGFYSRQQSFGSTQRSSCSTASEH